MSKILQGKATDVLTGVLGRDNDGETVAINLEKLPHLLVAGTTGSGKSVGVNMLLISIMQMNTPRDVRMVIIDPKKVEFTMYKGCPFMLFDPITEMANAEAALTYIVELMEHRFTLLSRVNVRNLAEYNNWIKNNPKKAKKLGHRHMPRIVCVVDEYADLMAVVRDSETYIQRIAQKARACGVHLIIATQRPDVQTISPTLKANIPGRFAFKVAGVNDSGIILGEEGAERLRGRGDCIVRTDTEKERLQFAFLKGSEIEGILEHLKDLYGDVKIIDYQTWAVNTGVFEWVEGKRPEDHLRDPYILTEVKKKSTRRW